MTTSRYEPIFPPKATWRPPTSLPRFGDSVRVSIDLETFDPKLSELGPGPRKGGYIAGVALAIEGGPSTYLPVRHPGPGNFEEDQVQRYLIDEFKNFNGVVVAQNNGYEQDFLGEWGIDCTRLKWRDPMIADALLYEHHNSYSLDAICQRIGMGGKDESLLRAAAARYGLDPKAELAFLPAAFVAEYATQDAVATLEAIKHLEKKISDDVLDDIYALENRLPPIFAAMRAKGIRIDFDRLDKATQFCLKEEERLKREFEQKTGYVMDSPWAKDAIVPALEASGVVLPRTPKGDASVDKLFLERCKNPVADMILGIRKVNKLRTTFCASIAEFTDTDGRLRGNFNQLRARTGRPSSSKPNLQQIPATGELGRMLRSCFIPDEGELWASVDFSAQEPRILTHYAEKLRLPRAREMAEEFRRNPKADNHTMMAKMIHGAKVEETEGFKDLRKKAKVVFLAKAYGAKGGKIATQLGLPVVWVIPGKWDTKYDTNKEADEARQKGDPNAVWMAGPEAAAIIREFDGSLPYVETLSKRCAQRMEERGFITTLLGRRCRPDRYKQYYKAGNALIQGSAADMTKKALADAFDAGILPQLAIHDEIAGSFPDSETADRLGEIMSQAVELTIPTPVDVETSYDSWGDSMKED